MPDKDTKPATPPTPVRIGGESLADRLAPHVKKILVGIVLLAVTLTIIFTFRWIGERKQQAQTEKLAQVLDVARRPVKGTANPELDEPKETKEPEFATRAERASAVLDAMTKQGAENVPSAYRGGLLLDAGKVDDAITEYRKGTTAPGIDGVLAREGLGIALETKALAEKDAGARQRLLEESLAAFVAEQPDEGGARRVYALYHQGRLQAELGKRAEAKALFEKAKELASSTDLSQLIDQRLSAIGT